MSWLAVLARLAGLAELGWLGWACLAGWASWAGLAGITDRAGSGTGWGKLGLPGLAGWVGPEWPGPILLSENYLGTIRDLGWPGWAWRAAKGWACWAGLACLLAAGWILMKRGEKTNAKSR